MAVCGGFLVGQGVGSVRAQESDLTPEYMMPDERAALDALNHKTMLQDTSEEAPEILKVRMGRLNIAHIPGNGTTVVLSRPEVAEVHVESPDFLFVRGMQAGETELVVADRKLKAIYTAHLVVVPANAPDSALEDTNPVAPPPLSDPAVSSAPGTTPSAEPGG